MSARGSGGWPDTRRSRTRRGRWRSPPARSSRRPRPVPLKIQALASATTKGTAGSAGLDEADVVLADEAHLGPVRRRTAPGVPRHLEGIALAVEGVLAWRRGSRPPPGRHRAARPAGGRGAGSALAPKKTMLTPACFGGHCRLALAERPALVMAEREQDLVVPQDARVLLDGDVGDVGDVQAVLFDKAHEGVLAAEEVPGPLAVAVRPVERDDPRPGAQRVDVAAGRPRARRRSRSRRTGSRPARCRRRS